MLLRVVELLKAITVLLCRIKHVLDRLCWQPVQLKNVCSRYQSINKSQAMRCGAMSSLSERVWGAPRLCSVVCTPFFSLLIKHFFKGGLGLEPLSQCNPIRCFEPESGCGEWDQLSSHESQVPAPRIALGNCSTCGKRVDGGDQKSVCGGISGGEEIWREADSDWTVWKFKDKLEELLVFNRHMCSAVCSSIKGGLEEYTSVHALRFNLLVPFFLPFLPGYHLIFFPSLSSMGEGEKRH